MIAKLRKGYGYWDVTRYPYGGNFMRAGSDMEVTVLGPAGKYPDRECKVQFADGRIGVVPREALIGEEARGFSH